MKPLLLLTALFFTVFTSQSQDIEGTYANKWIATTGEGIEYTLTLNDDGNFTFNYTRMYMDTDSNTEVKVNGTWNLENNLLVLKTENDTEEDNGIASGLDLNRARFVSISPRHPKFNLVKPTLKFYESDVFYAKDMELIKIGSPVSSVEVESR
ncbi:MAG: copper resistance protein NlpE N-terminal domain-containing protein [Aquaticitalea sp.]